MKHILRPAFGVVLAAGLSLSTAAAESTNVQCFTPAQFESGDATLTGICLRTLPEQKYGTVMLGSRQLRPGDVLTAQQVEQMTFVCRTMEEDATASISYLPVFSNGLAGEATMTLAIKGRENKPPVAEDSAYETYKNLVITESLRVHDPEGEEMTFTLTRPPKRGSVELKPNGNFTYTPKKNKVGVDSFTFTATDSTGKVSREATVTVSILKPTDTRQYSDTLGRDCRFQAEWMKNTGIFVGENVGGSACFLPDQMVSRGEFVTMLVKTLDIPTDENVTETGYTDVPQWLQPYLAAAIRSGLTAGVEVAEEFLPSQPVSAGEAASMLCAALKLQPQEQAVLSDGENTASAQQIAAQNGFTFRSDVLTRGEAAVLLYQANQFRMK